MPRNLKSIEQLTDRANRILKDSLMDLTDMEKMVLIRILDYSIAGSSVISFMQTLEEQK